MKVKVLFFGKLSELVNGGYHVIENVSDMDKLLSELNTKFPSLKDYKYRIAVNLNIESETTALKNGDEIALLPPFSGG